MTRSAPIAFEPDGRWNGEVLLPLLLVHAKAELLASYQKPPHLNSDDAQVAALSAEVSELADSVISTLAGRSDALPMFLRWANWIMRAVLINGEDEFKDIRSRSFVDDTLLKAIGKTLADRALPERLASDGMHWEDWCYRCVQASWAYNGFVDQPSFDAFAGQWRIEPENWYGQKGRSLRDYASLHLSSRNNTPDLLAHLLAVPLAAKGDFARLWLDLWDDAVYLREVLEFGTDDAGKERYADQSDASSLLLQLVCLGLACFDQVAGRLVATPGSPEEIVRLHHALSTAAMEVLHIDITINRAQWKAILHHLALRRVYWDRKFRKDVQSAMFGDQQSPTLYDFLGYLHAEPNDLLKFLEDCMQNQVDVATLNNELFQAGIDLNSTVDVLRRLHTFRANRYPMNGAALRAIEPLLQAGRKMHWTSD